MTNPRVITPPSAPKVDALTPELQELVLEFALAVHKRGIYPESHPMLHGAVEGLARRFAHLLAKRSQLPIGVSRNRLFIDGIATDESNPLLADLAGRLHEHEVGGVTFLPGVRKTSLEEFIAAISVSTVRGADPITRSRATLARWPDIVLTPTAFDRLELLDDEGENDAPNLSGSRRATELWNSLACAALDGDKVEGGAENPAHVAESIHRRVGNASYDQAVFGFLQQVIGEMGEGDARDPLLRQRVSQLVQNLDEASLATLLHMGGDVAARAELLQRASESLAAASVVRLTQAAAASAGESIAGSMLRLLSKLAKDAEARRPTGRTSDRALRGVIRHLLADWKLIDPNPETYTVVLTDIATAPNDLHADLGRDGCEADRILQIGIASGSKGQSVESALARLIATSGLATAVETLLAMEVTPLRDEIVDRLINESTFREQLAIDHPDQALLRHAVARLHRRAVLPLLAELERRDDSAADWIVELLACIGTDAVEDIVARFETLTPRVIRHVIVLLERLDTWPAELEPMRYARHADVSVRREMIRFMLKRDATREQAVLTGLRDPDTRVFNLALGAASSGCSPEAARVAMHRLEDVRLGDELRARGVRVIAESRRGDVRDWLVRRSTTRRWLFRSLRLRKPSLELFAVLGALATYHADEPDAQRVLDLARRSRSADIRRAATARVTTTIHA